jgi:hypothetical protein
VFSSVAYSTGIQEAAYQSAKLATRYSNLYTDAVVLFAEAAPLINTVGVAMKHSFLRPAEAGTAWYVLGILRFEVFFLLFFSPNLFVICFHRVVCTFSSYLMTNLFKLLLN